MKDSFLGREIAVPSEAANIPSETAALAESSAALCQHSPARSRVLLCLWASTMPDLPLTRAKKEVSSSSGKSTVSSSRKLAGVKLRRWALLRVLSFTERPCSQDRGMEALNTEPPAHKPTPAGAQGAHVLSLVHACG